MGYIKKIPDLEPKFNGVIGYKIDCIYEHVIIKRLAGRNWRFISLRGSEGPGFAFGSPASCRCAAGAARRTRFHPASPSAHLPAAAARRAPLAELAFTRVRLRLTRGAGFAGSPGRILRIREGFIIRIHEIISFADRIRAKNRNHIPGKIISSQDI